MGFVVDTPCHVQKLVEAPPDEFVSLNARPRSKGGVYFLDPPVGSYREIAARGVLEQVPVVVGGQELRHMPGWLRPPLPERLDSGSARSP